MSKTPKMDNGIIEVAGLKFSSQLGIASAQWLEAEMDMGIVEVLEQIQAASTKMNVTLIAKIVTALYLQAHLDEDPQTAQRTIGKLLLPEMMDLLTRATFAQFDATDKGEAPLSETQV